MPSSSLIHCIFCSLLRFHYSSSSYSSPYQHIMKKLVLKLDLDDDRAKQKAMNAVTELSGIDSLAIDMKERILTVIGTADPIGVVRKLRKHWATEIISVGPVKEPEPEKKVEEKKEGEKKDENKAKEVKKEEVVKKGEPVKDEGKGNEVKKEEQKKKEDEKKADHVFEIAKHYRSYNPHMTSYYHAPSMEDNPNSCVIT